VILPITDDRPGIASISSDWRPVISPLPRSLFREELLAIRKAVGLEEEADDNGAVGRHRLVLVAGRPPDKLTRSAYALVIFDRALEHISLFQRGVLVQRHDRARGQLEQGW
jgi:hypothetical protein